MILQQSTSKGKLMVPGHQSCSKGCDYNLERWFIGASDEALIKDCEG